MKVFHRVDLCYFEVYHTFIPKLNLITHLKPLNLTSKPIPAHELTLTQNTDTS